MIKLDKFFAYWMTTVASGGFPCETCDKECGTAWEDTGVIA